MKLKELAAEVLRNPSGELWVQVIRYLISGGVAFVIDAGLLAILTECFSDRLLLLWTALSFLAGLTVTYLFSILWVFDKRNLESRTAEISIFALIGASGLALTELLMWLFTGKAGIHYMVAKAVTTVLVFVWNFAAKKTFLFSNREK